MLRGDPSGAENLGEMFTTLDEADVTRASNRASQIEGEYPAG